METPQIVQFQHLKTQTQSWMAVYSLTNTVRTQLSSALSQLAKGISRPLLSRMADGVQRALTHWRRLISTGIVATAKTTAEEVLLQTMFTSLKIKLTVSVSFFFFQEYIEYNTYRQMFNVNNSRINLKEKQLYEIRQLVCAQQLGKRAP